MNVNVSTRQFKFDNFIQSRNTQKIKGGAGLFGEVKGPCGWKDSAKYDCCFTKCKPTWKTRLFPFNIKL